MPKTAPAMTIARLAEAGSVGVETIRFYQRKGLMPVPAAAGSVRHYTDADIKHLRFIRSAQRAGFSLKEIAELLSLNASHDRLRVQAITRSRLAAIDTQMAELSAARAALAGLLEECAQGHDGPCPIIATFDAAVPACHQPFAAK